jgi:subtilase family serine protease
MALVGLVAVLSGCGIEAGEELSTEQAPVSEETTQMGPSESWCRSYTTQAVCPKYICAWYGTYCSLPASSVQGQPEPAVEETTQMGPSESWCRSYTTQRYCPSVCYWYSYPAPGYCGLKPTSVTQ